MKFKKLIAVILCFTLIFCSLSVVSNASLTSSITATFETRKNFGNKITNIIQGVLKGFNSIYPKPMTWKSIDTFDGTYVYDEADGRGEYLTEPKDGANWNVGYASGSIIPDDFAKNKYYMGRQLNVVASAAIAKADGILDDQRVRVICINDNNDGKGAVVMAVIDGLGVTSGTIRAIREGLKEYTEDGRIASINISATHTHSALDTQGVSTSLLYVLFANTFTNILGLDRAKTSNDKFIETIKSVTVAKVKEAYDNMESGKLYYDTADGSDYIYDKREYITQDNIPPIGVIRFQPDNEESKGTYFVNMTCHPTNVSAKAGLVSADYPFYMDYTFQKNGYNFIMTQGAVGMVSGLGGKVENDPNYTTAVAELGLVEKLGADKVIDTSVLEADAFAEKITEIILASGEDGEEELKPVINNKYTYTQFTTTNYTLHLACRCRLVDNPVYTTGRKLDDVVLPSEIGYLELGSRVAFGLFPCEFYPEVFHGQDIITEDVENYSWDGSEWTVPSAHNMVKDGIDIHAICFANDYIGYVVPDNYYSGWGHWSLKGTDKAYYEYDPDASIFDYAFRGTADELLSAGKTVASQIMNGFNGIVDSLENKEAAR